VLRIARKSHVIKILLADPHPVVREGVKRILAETPDLQVAGEASTAQEVLAQVAATAYDVVLLDLALPDRQGLAVLDQLTRTYPKLPVLIFSVHPERHYAARALWAGAAGYLTKDSPPTALMTAIRKVAHGGRYVSAPVAEQLAEQRMADVETPRLLRLSDREWQVLCLLASGKTLPEIAAALGLSRHTIGIYRANLTHKLGVRTTAALIHYAISHRLVE
jgi:DNA-binding NarL/FixJ family response regulator